MCLFHGGDFCTRPGDWTCPTLMAVVFMGCTVLFVFIFIIWEADFEAKNAKVVADLPTNNHREPYQVSGTVKLKEQKYSQVEHSLEFLFYKCDILKG